MVKTALKSNHILKHKNQSNS